jgi:cyanophycinase
MRVAKLEAPGTFFLVGGGDTQTLTYERFLRQAGGAGAPVVVVPFAGSPAEGEGVRQALERLGAQARLLTGAEAQRANELAAIRQANGLYFPGGVPERLLSGFAPFAEAARAAWQSGCVIGGTSAGAMVWGSRMIVKGDSGPVRLYGLDERQGGAAVRPALGWLGAMTVDPHFGERARMHRLWLAAGETRTLGLGVDEGTIAVFSPAGLLKVLGMGTVTVIRPEGGAGEPARLTILKQGDELDWTDWALDDAR